MNVSEFTKDQRQALLDLLVVTMYVDGNLKAAEEIWVEQALTTMGFQTEYDRNREFDAAVTRVRQHTQTADAARDCAVKLAQKFTIPEQRREVLAILNELAGTDGAVAPEETNLLAAVQKAFRL
jgi:uncharacterized tellurite resistance protein B-like protein